MNKILQFFNLDEKINWRVEILAGLTVAMTMIPESLSFAILAGFPPLSGLYAAFIAGLVAAMFGGRPGLISGGAGATVVTLIALIKSYSLEYAFAAVALAGVIQILVGIFKWAKYICLVPESVMYGFVNGLAFIIFSAQNFSISNSAFAVSGKCGRRNAVDDRHSYVYNGRIGRSYYFDYLFLP